MKRALLLSLAVLAFGANGVNADERDLTSVLIVDVQWTITSEQLYGFGHGNYMVSSEPRAWRGFTFTADCGTRFPVSEDRYDYAEGYWKKFPTRLVLLLEEIGGKKQSKCELKTTLREDNKLYSRPGFSTP